MYTRQTHRQRATTRACLPACLPAYLPACLPACMHACMHAGRRACMPTCVRACMRACMPRQGDTHIGVRGESELHKHGHRTTGYGLFLKGIPMFPHYALSSCALHCALSSCALMSKARRAATSLRSGPEEVGAAAGRGSPPHEHRRIEAIHNSGSSSST